MTTYAYRQFRDDAYRITYSRTRYVINSNGDIVLTTTPYPVVDTPEQIGIGTGITRCV